MSSSQTQVTDFPLRGIQLLEASAGTGKTWNISSLYVRLVLGHGRSGEPLMPGEILVVTFTKAATQELQDRIRKRLNEAAQFIRNLAQEPDKEHPEVAQKAKSDDSLLEGLRAYYEEYPDDRESHAYRLSLAADAMDDAAIFTIHGWCQRILKQHAFDSGSLFDLTIETDEADLLRECVRDYWRTVVYPLPRSDVELLQSFAQGPESLRERIKDLIQLPPETLEDLKSEYPAELPALEAALKAWNDWKIRIGHAEAHARSMWSSEREEIEAEIWRAKETGLLNNNTYKGNTTPQWLEAITAWANNPAAIPKAETLGRFATGRFSLNPKGTGEEPSHEAFRAIADFLALKEDTETQGRVKNALTSTATFWVRTQFERIKNDRAVIDRNDLVLKLHEAILGAGGERLAEIIREQYPVALIDEFQDTDPLQYGIFKAVYGKGSSKNAWLMVGDPKQAIYSFRGADIYSYLDARNQPGVERHTLDTNFRSTHEMVSAVNRIFSEAEQRCEEGGAFNFPKRSDGERPISFESVIAKDRPERLYDREETLTGLRFWHFGNAGAALGSDKYRDQMANIAANTIADLLGRSLDRDHPTKNTVFFAEKGFENARCLEPKDIAILVSSWREAKAIQEALRARGLKSVYLSDSDSILKTNEAKDLTVWLEAFIAPRDGRRIRSAMATLTLRIPYPTLAKLNRDELYMDSVIERFVGYGALWREKGILPAIRQFILDEELPAKLVDKPYGERCLTNLLHLAELLQREAANLDGQNGLLRYLRESIEDTGNDEENVLRLESDSALIRVITIHKSKGLEFPLVFLPFIAIARTTKPTDKCFKFHDEHLKLKVSLDAENDLEPSPIALTDRERLQESLRLFYVALTRACHACWIGIGPYKSGASDSKKEKDKNKAIETDLHHGALGYVLGRGKPITTETLGPLLEALKGEVEHIQILEVEKEDPITYPVTEQRRVGRGQELRFHGGGFESWRIESYSGLLGYKSMGDAESRQDEPGDEDRSNVESQETGSSDLPGLHGFPAGPSHGDYLHKLLEDVGKAGFDRVARDPHQRRAILEKTLIAQRYEAFKEHLDGWLERFIQCDFKIGGKSFRLADLSVVDCRMEMEFWFEINRASLQEVDRIVTEGILPGAARPKLKEEQLNGMLKGFMDLTFRFDGQFYVADYKSNKLGKTDASFTKSNQDQEVLKHRYDLQYSLYLLALHRYLKSRLGTAYHYDTWIGGVVYFFLRGIDGETRGIHFVKPPAAMIEALDAHFSGNAREVSHAA